MMVRVRAREEDRSDKDLGSRGDAIRRLIGCGGKREGKSGSWVSVLNNKWGVHGLDSVGAGVTGCWRDGELRF